MPQETRTGRARDVAVTIGAAALGALGASAAGLPAGPLVGAALSVTALALAGGRAAIPVRLRNAAFATIGVALGAGIGPGVLSDLARWPLSLAVLAGTIALTLALSSLLLRRTGMEGGTALLAVSPGALSVALALSEETGRDTRTVAILQAVRLLALTVALPPLLAGATGGAGAGGPALPPGADTGYALGAVLLALAMAGGWTGARLGMPAAYLLSGFALSAAVHAAGLVEGRLPAPVSFAGFAVTGAVIGGRLRGVTMPELARSGGVALALTAMATGIAAAAAWPVARALGVPFGQVMIAFAPEGWRRWRRWRSSSGTTRSSSGCTTSRASWR